MPSQQGTNPLVRVDSPTDIVVLAPHSALVPEAYFDTSPQTKPPGPLEALGSDEYWRTHGNDLFKQSHWFPAAVAYSRGLALKPDSLVLLLNRAEAYLRLGFFSGALCDVLAVLSSESAELTPAHRGKALLRAARAEYGRRNYARAMDFFRQHKDTGGRNSEDAIWIRKCDDRLKESATGVYNWARLFQESQRESKLDVGEYTGPVEVQEIPGRGRGLVATRDIAPGELLVRPHTHRRCRTLFEQGAPQDRLEGHLDHRQPRPHRRRLAHGAPRAHRAVHDARAVRERHPARADRVRQPGRLPASAAPLRRA